MSRITANISKLYFLYAALVILQCMWSSSEAGPPTLFRIAYWIAVFLPAILNRTWMPMAVALFYTLSSYGYAYGYMPYDTYWYCLFAVASLLVAGRSLPSTKYGIFLLFAFYTAFIDLITSGELKLNTGITIALLTVFVLIPLFDDEDGSIIERMSLGFAVVTIGLSTMFFTHYSEYAVSYSMSGMERSGWIDPNYFGMVLSFGGISSMFELTRRQYSLWWFKYVYIAAIIIVIPALVLNASRGAILAFALAFAVILLKSNVKKSYKIGIIALGAAFIAFLFTTSIFDLLIYRLNNDDVGGGSGRLDIWQSKLKMFAGENPISILFGMGSERGLQLNASGASRKVGFHNDYIAFLVKYGIIGLIIFVTMLIMPLKNITKNSDNYALVIGGVIAMALYGMTLEPYSSGGFAYWMFYLYILKMSSNKAYYESSLDS